MAGNTYWKKRLEVARFSPRTWTVIDKEAEIGEPPAIEQYSKREQAVRLRRKLINDSATRKNYGLRKLRSMS